MNKSVRLPFLVSLLLFTLYVCLVLIAASDRQDQIYEQQREWWKARNRIRTFVVPSGVTNLHAYVWDDNGYTEYAVRVNGNPRVVTVEFSETGVVVREMGKSEWYKTVKPYMAVRY